MSDKDHMYYSVSTLQEIVDEINDKYRRDIPKDGCYIGGIMTATGDLLGMLNTRHPDVVITREAVDVHQMQSTIDELRAKNKRLESDLKSARETLDFKDYAIRSLEKQCDELGKELTGLKICDYYTLEQVRELVPEPQKFDNGTGVFVATFNSGWNACVRAMNDRVAKTPPAGHTLSETEQADDLNKLKADVRALVERLKHFEEAMKGPEKKK